jgi:hypothetical protein
MAVRIFVDPGAHRLLIRRVPQHLHVVYHDGIAIGLDRLRQLVLLHGAALAYDAAREQRPRRGRFAEAAGRAEIYNAVILPSAFKKLPQP